MNRHGILALIVVLVHLTYIQALKCPFPASNTNGIVEAPNLDAGSTATYKCDNGYQLFGDQTRTCSSDGQWSGDSPVCATNVAWRKPVSQSSNVRGGEPENANDGNPTSIHDGDKCSETLVEDSPWWSVDLMQEYEISVVRITSRACCGDHSVQDLEIRVGTSTTIQKNRLCAWNPGALEKGETKDFKCAGRSFGRYVYIQMVGVKGSLSLCEVEVLSSNELSKDRCKGNLDENNLSFFNGSCYEFQVGNGGNFEKAKNYCQKYREGSLLQQTSPMEQDFVTSELNRLASDISTKLLWIGVQKDEGFISRTWRWLDGTVVNKPPWGKDQPNNYNGEQNCVVLDGGRGWLWNDIGCDLGYLYWICQFQPTCGSPNRMSNTTYVVLEDVFESVASYSCFEGSAIMGSSNRSCLSNGQWDGNAPVCKYVDCGNPLDIENGKWTLLDSRTSFSAKVLYECSDNYTMQGNNRLTCEDHGKWSPKAPECLYSWCNELYNPKHGQISLGGRRAGDIASFTCDPGYSLKGEKSLSCNLGGFWSGKEPTCEFIDCGLPESLHDGEMILLNKTTHFDSIASYNCHEDFKLDGLPTRKCAETGYWTGEVPACFRINCNQPEVPIGGFVTGYSFDVHNVVNYHCEDGHYLTGDSSRTCLRTAKWSGETPTCTFVDCGRLPIIRKGEISYFPNNKTILNSIATYKCASNYKMEGNDTRICRQSGQWTGVQPMCKEIRCQDPGHPKKSRIKVVGNDRRMSLGFSAVQSLVNVTFKVGSKITYLCERSYVLDGDSTITCQRDSSWSESPPKCKFVECPQPKPIQNGEFRLLSNETTFGSVVSYGCHGNWKLYGKLRRHCLANGTWSDQEPQCEEVLCSSLSDMLQKKYKSIDEEFIDPWKTTLLKKREQQKLLRLQVEKDERRVGSTAYYKCDIGRRLVGEPGRLCQQHGVWGGKEPSCEWVECPEPEKLENGQIHSKSSDTRYGAEIEYYCQPQYRLYGTFNRSCTENGTWSNVAPQCLDENSDVFASGNTGIPTANQDGSYVGIYVGVLVALLLLAGVGASLFFIKNRKDKLGSDRSAPPSQTSTDIRMNYGDLKDPSTGNHIYEDLPETDSNFYANIHETQLPPVPLDYYANSDYALRQSNGTHSPMDTRQLNGDQPRIPISQRPRMPPPQPPVVPQGYESSTKTGVTINGLTLNNNNSNS